MRLVTCMALEACWRMTSDKISSPLASTMSSAACVQSTHDVSLLNLAIVLAT